ncbi:hypothetical protein K438DRAFT_1955816 [Mycena galopus ATCC 62051]|nr:hypothetical protein K438DRAFT_1955816 [Mycena galopus ATCC 62051]
MQSLYQMCSELSKHILLPSHIVLSGGGFVLLPELAEILTDIVHPLGQLLDLAMRDSGLPGIQPFCHTELQILTCTKGLDITTQNQVVWNWIHLVEKVYIAMVDLRSLRYGCPIHVLGHEHPSQMLETVIALCPSLHAKLPAEFLWSLDILMLSPSANLSDAVHQHCHIHKSEHAPSWPPVDLCAPLSCAETGGLPSPQASFPTAVVHAVTSSDISRSIHYASAARAPRPSLAIAVTPAFDVPCANPMCIRPKFFMADLVFAYNTGSDSRWSLFSRTTRIVRKRSLNSSDIAHLRNDSSLPYFSQVRLEQPLFLSTANAVLEMQWLLIADKL